VDYVVVVQTPAMIAQVKGYFHKEINTALKQQEQFEEGFRFLLPVMLSECRGVARLRQLHNISLDKPDGFTSLVEAIRTDWQKRQDQAVKRA
jgi:hypothetical protein